MDTTMGHILLRLPTWTYLFYIGLGGYFGLRRGATPDESFDRRPD